VDGFQGGEREAVVLSLVRSSACGGEDGVGFLKDDRRLNVAITRARRHCCVICDTETISQQPFLRGLVDWVDSHGDIVSAMEIEQRRNLSPAVSDNIIQQTPEPERRESQRMIKLSSETKLIPKKTVSVSRPEPVKNDSKLQSLTSRPQQNEKQEDDSSRVLRNKLLNFKDTSNENEICFDSSLSKFQRREIHQICEEIGLLHRSEGSEGVDRKIIVSKHPIINGNAKEHSAKDELIARDESDDKMKKEPAIIAHEKSTRSEALVISGKSKPKIPDKSPQTSLDDDMEFLDAEISRLQSSHGRKIEADGKNYRTIVNGVLMSRPKPVESISKNSGTVLKLNQKIKEAQDRRKTKSKTTSTATR